MHPTVQTLLRPLVLLFPPSVVLFLLHLGAKRAFGPNNVVLGFYARDIYIPVTVAAVAVFTRWDLQYRFHFTARWKTIGLTLGTTALGLLTLEHADGGFLWFGAAGYCALLAALFTAAILSACFWWLPPRTLLACLNDHCAGMLVGLLALLGLLNYPALLKAAWPLLSRVTGEGVAWLLGCFGYDVEKAYTGYNFILAHRDLRIYIGMGCSGLEGLFFFLLAFSAYLTFEQLKAPRKMISGALLGVAGIFVLNLVRIALFFIVGVYLNRNWGVNVGTELLVWAFHENIGWVLYFIGISAFLFYWDGARLSIRRPPS